jgi:phosphoribosylformimino-5-aminoimidazole carboxamide ribotide isomerase
MKVLPAIDLKDGNCVRLFKGNFSQVTKYNDDPISQVKTFLDHDLNYLHIVDLDGAESGNQLNINLIKEILKIPSIKIQVGGGIRDIDSISRMIDLGVSRVILGTSIFTDNFLNKVKANFDPSQIVLALDFKNIEDELMIFTHGWKENSKVNLFDFISDNSFFKNILATDISLDGVLIGPSFNAYKKILELYPSINLIASGGIRSKNDLNALSKLNVKEAVVGKAIYEQEISLTDLSNDY